MKILYVDDESIQRKAKSFLERFDENIQVSCAPCFEKAILEMKCDDFDAVISGYRKDGLELLEILRKDMESDIPFIFFTDDDGKGAVKALNLGADRYLNKDVSSDSQYRVLAEAVMDENERYQKKKLINGTKVIEDSMDGVAITDKEGKYLYTNDSYSEIYGFDSDELIGERWTSQYDEGWIQRFDNEVIPECRERGEWKGEAIGVKKDGTAFPQKISLTRHDDGGFTFIVRDISEQKKVKRTLEQRYRYEQTVASISSKLVSITDFDRTMDEIMGILGSFTQADRVYLFELNKDERFLDNTYEWCDEGVTPQIDNLQHCSVEAFPWWMEKLSNDKVINIKDVSSLPSEASAEKKTLEAQDIKSVLVFPIKSEEKLEGFIGLDNTTSAEGWSKMDTKLLHIISEIISNAFKRKKMERDVLERVKELGLLYGLTKVESSRRSEKEIMDNAVKLIPSGWQYPDITSSKISFEDEEYITENYRETDWNITSDITINGKNKGFVEVNYLEESKEEDIGPFLEEEINLLNEFSNRLGKIMENIQAEKRHDFLHSILRHDVRNKIQIAKGYVELIEEETGEKWGYTAKIKKNIESAEEVIDKVRVLNEVELEEEKKEVDIGVMMESITSKYKEHFEEKGILIRLNELDGKVKGGPLLDTLFWNLIENSIKHSGCDEITISGEIRDNKFVVTVEDDGVGLTDEEKEKVFHKGYRKGESAGTGLGLYLVKEIAENYGANVEVKDSQMGGVRFDVELERFL